MNERRTIAAGAADRSERAGPARVASIGAWLRARLLPRGEGILALAAYAIILAALISLIVLRPPREQLPDWRFYGTILALAALLALNMTEPDLQARLGTVAAARLQLLGGAALFLGANALGPMNVIFYLIFMLTAQAFAQLSFRWALLYSVALAICWLALLWARSDSLQLVIFNALSLGAGMFFCGLFALVLQGYGRQTARAEALLRELQAANAELLAARERERDLAVAEERVRLARDIHDGLGHHLTVLAIQLQAAAKLVGRDPGRAGEAIALCREEAQAALDEVRRSVATMRSTPLDGRPLDEALAALVRDFDRHSSVAARFERRGDADHLAGLPPAAAMTLYRAAQEGLTNAQKHAAADSVTVELHVAAAEVRLAVRDDGRGPHMQQADGDTAQARTGGGFGLAGLRERAEQLGGTFRAGPGPDGGFQIEIVLPAISRLLSAVSDGSPGRAHD